MVTDRFDRLLVENIGWIRKAARRYCRDRSEAEELASEAVARMLRHKRRYDFAKGFRPWALAVIHNTRVSDLCRRRLCAEADIGEADCIESGISASSLAEARRIMAAVRECARKSVSIECVVLFAKGFAYHEIAEMVGIGMGTVKSRIAYGRKLIAKALGIVL